MAASADLLYDLRSCRVKQFHPDLYERFAAGKLIKECQGLFFGSEVTGDNYIFCHISSFYFTMPMISASSRIPY